jgi:hypothetical protein
MRFLQYSFAVNPNKTATNAASSQTDVKPHALLRSLIPTCLVSLIALGIFSAAAQAETTGPVWKIVSVSNPTNFKPGDKTGSDVIMVTATNVGGSSTGCTAEQITDEPRPAFSPLKRCSAGSPVVPPVTIDDVLPSGLTAVEAFGENAYHDPVGGVTPGAFEGVLGGMSCTKSSSAVSCTTSEPVDPGDTLFITIRVDVSESAPPSTCPVPAGATSCVVNVASVSGGGATGASVSGSVAISSALPAYGVAKGGLFGASSTSQAGGHPNVTNEFFLNTINPKGDELGEHGCGDNFPPICTLQSEPVGVPKDVRFDLPPGLVGTTVGMPRCTMAEVIDNANCPRDTMVGATTLMFFNRNGGRFILTVPVYNIAPAPGEPAAFAFNALFFPVRLDTSVLSDGEYNVRVTAPDITTGAADYFSSVTIWGVPAEHNGPGPDAAAITLAGEQFLLNIANKSDNAHKENEPQVSFGGPGVEESYIGDEGLRKIVSEKRVPLLTNPSQCSTPLTAFLETDSWEAQGPGVFAQQSTSMGTATGCDLLSFKPSVSMLPDTLEAGAPAGYSFDLSLPQDTEAESLATPDVKRTSVTLPLGTVISPSAADGLGVCTSEQFDLHSGVPGGCPNNSQVGTVRSKTPALEEALTGDVYLAAPECTGSGGVCTPQDAADGHMIRLFLQLVGEGEDGIVVKQELTGVVNQQTGQLTVIDGEVPEVPFSDLKLTLAGGERATLANPRTCGTVTTTADLTPWSTPFTPDGTPESSFNIDENCFATQFNPSFSFGTTSNQAGGYSPFSVSFGRGDHDGFLNGIQVRTPPGLLGMLSHVKLCEEPQANAGTCGPESQIGETTVETGPGADPFLVTGGKVYITGPYKGAPYGLSIVVPAKAGPYTLAGTTGNGTVVNRSAISVNPETSALTVTSDPLPTELDGIPLQLRLVNVTINRPEFMFNATSCDKTAIGGTLTDTQAASAVESSSYQVTNCGALKFQPKFTVATSGKTSRANGASLDAKVAFPNTGQGTQADIHSFKVDLPKQLPSRLTTLQKACLASVFEANPANCPAPSVIGTVRVNTPVLPVQLTGPVYFVSHGGEAFPSLEIVLQGDGVRVDVVAATFISKAGITSSTFKTVPDVPFESFELYLPEGKYSALAANGTLCTSKLAMPTAIVAQNGAKINESTPIAVTGCPKAKTAVKKKTKKKGKKASRARKSSIGTGGKS